MSNLYDELNNIINEIPEEVKDCFAIYINKDKANELVKEMQKFTEEKIEFPITYKNIPVAIHQYVSTYLELIETPEKITKVYLYEKSKIDNYLKEYEKLCKKYNIGLCGCGCCGSPYLYELYTIAVDNVNYKEGRLQYDLSIKCDYEKYLR